MSLCIARGVGSTEVLLFNSSVRGIGNTDVQGTDDVSTENIRRGMEVRDEVMLSHDDRFHNKIHVASAKRDAYELHTRLGDLHLVFTGSDGPSGVFSDAFRMARPCMFAGSHALHQPTGKPF